MMKSAPRLLCLAVLMVWVTGCTVTRQVTIRTKPADATVRIDGVERGRGVITESFTFESATQVHRIVASRMGYKDAVEMLTRDSTRSDILIELKTETRRISIMVEPVPAIISIDGQPVQPDQTTAVFKEVELGVDARNNPVTRTITAERPNFVTAKRVISRNDTDINYILRLEPLKKAISVTTTPPGADIFLDHEKLGVSPLADVAVEFPADLTTNELLSRRLRAEKAGFDPVAMGIGWDNGKTDYQLRLEPKTKQVRIISDPAGATVKIDGQEVPRDPSGMTIADLRFPPTNDKGDLKAYSVVVSKKTADSEWEPKTLTLEWDNGRTDYHVALKEILTRPVDLLSTKMRRTDDGWEASPEWTSTLAMKDVTEGPRRPPPLRVTSLTKGTQIGSMAVSPDGSQVLFTVLLGSGRGDFRSQMLVIRTDGSGGADIVSDGRSLDITPSFSPSGEQIIFSSNRAGKRMNIWSMSARGAPGITRLTSGDTNDLWPMIDSDPKPRLYYQAMVDTRSDPRLYMTQIGTIFQTDLTTLGGMRPRVSPKNDAILFCAVNEKTGKRDLYRMSDRGGTPENLTGTSDYDEFDATWSSDGSRIIFASDRSVDQEGRQNCDIWMMDLSKPQQPMQITTNGSHDDCPVFDVSGNNVYFRSNRGGDWAIWKMPIR